MILPVKLLLEIAWAITSPMAPVLLLQGALRRLAAAGEPANKGQ